MVDPIRETRAEPIEDQELSAVLEYLESLPPELFNPRDSLPEFFSRLLQPTLQQIRDDAVREMPMWTRHAAHLSSIASQQILSNLKDRLEFECARQMDAHKRFMRACNSITMIGIIFIFFTEVYRAIAASRGLSSDTTFLPTFPTLTAVGLSILLVYALFRISFTRRSFRKYRLWTDLLEMACYSMQ